VIVTYCSYCLIFWPGIAGYLLNLLDWCNKDVREWFDTNLKLKEEKPTLERIEALIKGGRVSESEYYKECLDEYRIFTGQDA